MTASPLPNIPGLDTDKLSQEEMASLVQLLFEQEKAREGDKLALYAPHAGRDGRPGQVHFHQSKAKIRMIITGNRWGKTTAAVVEAIWIALGVHPYNHSIPVPNRGKIYGESYSALQDSVMMKFEEWLPKKYLDPKKPYEKNQLGQITAVNFRNGSKIKFGTYDQQEKKAESSNWHYVAFDEPPPRELYIANLRGLVDFGGIMWFSMTPLSEAWIFDELYEPGLNGTKAYIDVFEGDSYDNPHVPRDALDLFASELTEQEKAVRIHGKFRKLAGLVIDTYDPFLSDIEPFLLDESFVIYEGIDPHPAKPNAALYKAVDRDGSRFAVAEVWFDGGIYDFGIECAIMRRELRKNGARFIESVSDTSLNQKDMMFKINQRQEFNRALMDMGESIMPLMANKKDQLFPTIQKLRDLFRPIQRDPTDVRVLSPTEFLFKGMVPRYKWELAHHQWPKDAQGNQKPMDKMNDMIACSRYIESRAPEFKTPGADKLLVRNRPGAYGRMSFEERMLQQMTEKASKYHPERRF